MFFTSGDQYGCGLYRTRYPAEMLGKPWHYGYPVYAEPGDKAAEAGLQNVKDCDILFVQRATNEYFLTKIPELQKQGKKVIYDIDDNLWEIPSTNPAFRPYNAPLKKQTKEIIKLCDALTVSTVELAEYFRINKFNKNIHVIPNMLHHAPEQRPKRDGKIRIGWWGTNTHAGDWPAKLVFALDKIKDKYDNVELVFMGWNPMRGDKKRYEFHNFQESDVFLDYLNKIDLDILVAPLIDCEFNRCKSNIKFLEASVCGVASVLSSVAPYKNTAEDGVTALMVTNEKQWQEKIEMLVENASYRKALAENAYTFVNENFTYANAGARQDELYTRLLESI